MATTQTFDDFERMINGALPTVTEEGTHPGIGERVRSFNLAVSSAISTWRRNTRANAGSRAVDSIRSSLITNFQDNIIPLAAQADNITALDNTLDSLADDGERIMFLVGGVLAALNRAGVRYSQTVTVPFTEKMVEMGRRAAETFSRILSRMGDFIGRVTSLASRLVTALLTPRTSTGYASFQAAVDDAIRDLGLDEADIKFDVLRRLLPKKIKYTPTPGIATLKSTGDSYNKAINAYIMSGKNETLARVMFGIAINIHGRISATSSSVKQALIQALVIETFIELIMTALEHDTNRRYILKAIMALTGEEEPGSQTVTNEGGAVPRPAGYPDVEEFVPIVNACIAGVQLPAVTGVPQIPPIRTLLTAIGIQDPATIAADFAFLREDDRTPAAIDRLRAIQRAFLDYVNARRPEAEYVNASLNATRAAIQAARQAALAAQAALALAAPASATAVPPTGGASAVAATGGATSVSPGRITGISATAAPPPPPERNYRGAFAQLVGELPSCRVNRNRNPNCSASVAALMDARIAAQPKEAEEAERIAASTAGASMAAAAAAGGASTANAAPSSGGGRAAAAAVEELGVDDDEAAGLLIAIAGGAMGGPPAKRRPGVESISNSKSNGSETVAGKIVKQVPGGIPGKRRGGARRTRRRRHRTTHCRRPQQRRRRHRVSRRRRI